MIEVEIRTCVEDKQERKNSNYNWFMVYCRIYSWNWGRRIWNKRTANEIAPDKKFGNLRLKDLFEEKMKKENKTIEELKQEYYNETKFDLGKIELIL